MNARNAAKSKAVLNPDRKALAERMSGRELELFAVAALPK